MPMLFAYWCRIHLWFRLMGGLQAKSMTSQRYCAAHKMADMRYYGNVMTTRWRICYYAKRYGNNKMAVMRYYGSVILHLQQYSHRLKFNFIFFNKIYDVSAGTESKYTKNIFIFHTFVLYNLIQSNSQSSAIIDNSSTSLLGRFRPFKGHEAP